MKAKITEVIPQNNATFNMTFDVIDEKGDILFTKTIGILNLDTDASLAMKYIKDAILNNKNQYLAEKASVAKDEVQKLVGQEFEI